MKRKDKPSPDFLEPLSGPAKRKRFCVFDIESKRGDTQKAGFTRPFLVGFYDPNDGQYHEFRDEPHLQQRDWRRRHIDPGGCVDKLLNKILTRQYSGHVFYAHNGGNFDFLFLLTWLREHLDEFGFEVIPVQSSIQVIRVWELPANPEKPIKHRWNFLDSMKLLPMGLDRACKTFGIPGKKQHDLHLHEDDPSWSAYLKQDCVALAAVMKRLYELVEDRLGGEVGMTAPSTAMKLFRREHLGKNGAPDRIYRHAHWPECHKRHTGQCLACAHDWIRRGYYGGRTEIIQLWGEKLHYYDINSSYVAAMCEDMPVGERTIETTKLDWSMYESHAGFAECTVFIPDSCEIPPLPHRHHKTGKLLFPKGRFHGVWSLEELKLLEDPFVNGRIESVTKVVWFRRKPVFARMMRDLYRLRDKRLADFDEGLSALAKLLGNSLYGKFGMRQERTAVVFAKPGKDRAKDKCFLCNEPSTVPGGLCKGCWGSKPAQTEIDGDWDVWYQAKTVEAPYIIPHIAAHITALARKRLWLKMKAVLELGGDIHYVDTDSIITNAVLTSSSELGELKDEYPKQELSGLFVQPKVYLIEATKVTIDDEKDVRVYLEKRGGLEDEEIDTFVASLDEKQHPAWGVDWLSWFDSQLGGPKAKVTMKGFPKAERTKTNLQKLQRGETIAFEQLEKVRTLAREGFKRPPQMRQVKKSFQTKYDKRTVHKSGRTSAIALDESTFELDHAAEE